MTKDKITEKAKTAIGHKITVTGVSAALLFQIGTYFLDKVNANENLSLSNKQTVERVAASVERLESMLLIKECRAKQ